MFEIEVLNQPSDNYNVIISFVGWNEDILFMEFLDAIFRMLKGNVKVSGKKVRSFGVKRNSFINKIRIYYQLEGK